ncbi:hypothetical protein T02_10049 [Trichinella nativa]|uniref:Uncharacterized protein n=1 Tax=Trichinella nativa TaxID=6335 RepID=A0A0V1KLI5_9BILA|nr:hypothetical protein T02_2263 [Trichinella nativa]KRZ49302.1 hypothetical protein T02_10049 [Trichinella nativa]
MCCGIPVHYQLGILNFYPSRSYGIYEFDVAEDDSMWNLNLSDTAAHCQASNPSLDLSPMQKRINLYLVSWTTNMMLHFYKTVPYEMNSSNGVSMFIFDPVVHRLLFDP